MFPDEGADWPEAVLLTTSGGLTGGDKTLVDVTLIGAARATVTTQAAEKLYRTLPGEAPTAIETRLSIGPGGAAEWLPQEAILFDASAMRRSVTVTMADDARFLGAEAIVLGRLESGETMRTAQVHDSWRIVRGGRMVWADALRLNGDWAALRTDPYGIGSHEAMATILYVGPDADEHLALARQLTGRSGSDLIGGATSWNGLLILRLLGGAVAVRAKLIAILCALRVATLARPPRLPAVWSC